MKKSFKKKLDKFINQAIAFIWMYSLVALVFSGIFGIIAGISWLKERPDMYGEYSYVEYEVQSGDTLWDLSATYASELNMGRRHWIRLVYDENGYSDKIRERQVIKIPVSVDSEAWYGNGGGR